MAGNKIIKIHGGKTMFAAKIRAVGWVLLIAGGIGTVISALIGSDWPMYSFIIISSAGSMLLISAKSKYKV